MDDGLAMSGGIFHHETPCQLLAICIQIAGDEFEPLWNRCCGDHALFKKCMTKISDWHTDVFVEETDRALTRWTNLSELIYTSFHLYTRLTSRSQNVLAESSMPTAVQFIRQFYLSLSQHRSFHSGRTFLTYTSTLEIKDIIADVLRTTLHTLSIDRSHVAVNSNLPVPLIEFRIPVQEEDMIFPCDSVSNIGNNNYYRTKAGREKRNAESDASFSETSSRHRHRSRSTSRSRKTDRSEIFCNKPSSHISEESTTIDQSTTASRAPAPKATTASVAASSAVASHVSGAATSHVTAPSAVASHMSGAANSHVTAPSAPASHMSGAANSHLTASDAPASNHEITVDL